MLVCWLIPSTYANDLPQVWKLFSWTAGNIVGYKAEQNLGVR